MSPSLRPRGVAAGRSGRLVRRIFYPLAVAGLVSGSVPGRARGVEVAAYAFNEGAGSFATDATGNGNQATLAGASWEASGKYGAALSFDGAGSRTRVSDAPGLDLRGGMTIEAWVHPLAHAGWETVVLKESAGEVSYALYANEEEPRPGVWVRVGGVTFNASGDSQLPIHAWTHLAGTYDGTMLRLYVNGIEEATQTAGGDIEVSERSLTFGGNEIWGEYFRGFIDEVRIHDRALTPAQVEADMAAPISGGGATVPVITAPVEGSVVAGTVLVSALPSTGAAVAGLQFLLDGASLGTEDVAPPYSVSWDSRTAAEGPHTLAARERLTGGGFRNSAAVSVTVLNTVGGTVRVDGGTRHQVIDGFGVNANSASWIRPL